MQPAAWLMCGILHAFLIHYVDLVTGFRKLAAFFGKFSAAWGLEGQFGRNCWYQLGRLGCRFRCSLALWTPTWAHLGHLVAELGLRRAPRLISGKHSDVSCLDPCKCLVLEGILAKSGHTSGRFVHFCRSDRRSCRQVFCSLGPRGSVWA